MPSDPLDVQFSGISQMKPVALGLNAEEEPEPELTEKSCVPQRYGPRGVLKTSADGKIEDSGPLTTIRMETVDEKFLGCFGLHRPPTEGKQAGFCYFNPTRM